MDITATDAKNRFGQVLEQAQKRPVFIEKSGRRHSVVMSVELYDTLLGAAASAGGAGFHGRDLEFAIAALDRMAQRRAHQA